MRDAVGRGRVISCAAILLIASCAAYELDIPADAPGELGGPCYEDATCDGGLECASNRCVAPEVAEGELGGPCYADETCDEGLKCLDELCREARSEEITHSADLSSTARDASPTLAVPQGVTASDGASAAHVEVSWESVSGATGYHVYRDGSRVTTEPLTEVTFNDTSAPAGGVPAPVQDVSATTDRPEDVEVSWSAPGSPRGESVSYQVRAVSVGQQSGLSSAATGFRAGHPVTGYEVKVGSGTWGSAGSSTTWTDESAPAGSLSVGTPTATTNMTTGVNLSVVASSMTAGATRSYRVRALNAAGAGAQSSPVSGARSVGAAAYQWQWSLTSRGNYLNLSGATSRMASDSTVASGATRWYRVVVSAVGASGVTSTAVQGMRLGVLGTPCEADSQCPSGAWCPIDTSKRRCSPRPSLGGVEMPFQWVPRGTFAMGSPEGEVGQDVSREGQVDVTLTRDYFVQRTPVTQGQWAAVMEAWNVLPEAQRTMSGWSDATPVFGTTPSCFRSTSDTSCTTTGSNPNGPVERVSWWDAVVYANVLSLLEGLEPCYTLSGCGTGTGVAGVGGGCSGTSPSCSGNFSCSSATFVGKSCTGYRLLTEAEWERAARGGTTTATYGGNLSGTSGCVTLSGGGGFASGTPLADLAWYSCNSGSRTQPVGGKAPNAWGLYDTLGNVWEWTWTWYASAQSGGTDPIGPSTGSSRALRGGSLGGGAQGTRAARRGDSNPVSRNFGENGFFGFRLARTSEL